MATGMSTATMTHFTTRASAARTPPRLEGGLAIEVRTQGLRHADAAVGLLVRLQQTDERAREGDPGAVERVDKGGLLRRSLPVADIRPARLERFEVAAAGNLEK